MAAVVRARADAIRQGFRRAAPLVLASTVVACTRTTPMRFATTTTAPEQQDRLPPAVAVDPIFALPAPRAAAHSGDAFIVLRAPSDVKAATETVRRFFDAVAAESMPALEALLDQNARLKAGPQGHSEHALASWRKRLQQLDYSTVAGRLLYRERDLQVYRPADVAALGTARSLPLAARDEEVVVRVFLRPPPRGGTRLFGDDVTFLLRPDNGAYKIAEIVEDFRLP